MFIVLYLSILELNVNYNQTTQLEPKLPENNVHYETYGILFSFQVQLNADINIELYAMYAVILHVLRGNSTLGSYF